MFCFLSDFFRAFTQVTSSESFLADMWSGSVLFEIGRLNVRKSGSEVMRPKIGKDSMK